MGLMSGRQPSSSMAEKGGLWRIDAERLTCLQPSAVTPGVVLVPSEQVLILGVDLPLPTRRQRLAALPFAIEERLAEPLEALHVALGVELSPGRYLAGVVRHDIMRDWTARLDAAGLGRSALIPDALDLPPAEDGAWSVLRMGDRALVRTADGRGFALPATMLAAAWASAGHPPIVSHGEPLAGNLPTVQPQYDPLQLSDTAPPPVLDLRQGPYSSRGRPLGTILRRLAFVMGAGAVAHAAIAAADTVALQNAAHARHDQALAMIRQTAPATPADADLVATLDRLLPEGGGAPGGFLPLLSRTSTALRPVSAGIAMRSIGYNAADGGLSLSVEAADMAGLQRVQGALAAAALSPSAGAATAESGRANGDFIVRDGARGRR
jgi:general secretion pathway protein L